MFIAPWLTVNPPKGFSKSSCEITQNTRYFKLVGLLKIQTNRAGFTTIGDYNMKKTIFLSLAIALIALNPLIVSAATDSKYPAADFEPSVIYIDKDAVAPDQVQNESDPKYPASNFTPIVVFFDNQLVDQNPDQFDPKYPAAYFKPKVIYP